jgi:cyclophilin family peptidyl-prolyl cis-trans isomerase
MTNLFFGKNALLLFLISFFIIQCTPAEEIEKLEKSREALKIENESLQSSLDILQKDKVKLDFLAQRLQGITAEITTSMGKINVEFYPDKAPLHVFTFVSRAESGFYDGTTFHRVIENFMIQGGDPNSKDNDPTNDGQGGPIAMLPHEFNDIKHVPGVLSTARVSDVNAGAGSQFFIMHGANTGLDNQYTVFGMVTEGMDVVNKIATTAKNPQDRPLKDVLIKSIKVKR